MNLRFGALAVTLLLSACASSVGQRETTTTPRTPVVIAPLPPSQPVPSEPLPTTPMPVPVPVLPSTPAPQNFPRTPEAISGQAVVSLMRQASEARGKGQFDLAASQLERAQRIEPRNYFVWSALAKVYLDQKQYDQAVSVAGKANSLARGNLYVEAENWKTIARAREAQGDTLGALQAQARLDEIARVLGGG